MQTNRFPIFVPLLLALACGSPASKHQPTGSAIESSPRTEQGTHAAEIINETISTPNSSWITGASYRSNDGITGRFVIRTQGRSYTYIDLPNEVWQGFKNAESKGKFYNTHIKGKYMRDQ